MEAKDIKAMLPPGAEYYNRFDPAKNWNHFVFYPGRFIQPTEFNEFQMVMERKIASLGYSLYSNGAIISGCDIAIDKELHTARLGAGRVFIDGLVWEVPAATLNIPPDNDVNIGIWLKSSLLTENEDSSLLAPCIGHDGYGAPGAHRVVTEAVWATDGVQPFYNIYGISGQEIVNQYNVNVTPEYAEALARYDRHAHDSYVTSGLTVTALDNAGGEADEGKQTFSVSEGEAHINGYESQLLHSVRLVVDEKAVTQHVSSEPHNSGSGGSGSETITLSNSPIENVTSVRVTKQNTHRMTHGSYTGCSDLLPHNSVVKIVEIKQDGTTYRADSDFVLRADNVDWTPGGAEPAPGSQYDVTYQYRANISPDEFSATDITVSDIVPDTLIEVDYSYRMPRVDIITLDRNQAVGIVRGVPHRSDPRAPATPPDCICLARVYQNWNGLPKVENTAIQRVPMVTLNIMQQNQRDQYNLIAQLQMQFDALISAPSSAFGVFTDPLFDDDMRDKGVEQNALIANQILQLPITTDTVEFVTDGASVMPYNSSPVIRQEQHTKCMQVNPYQAFEPIPPTMTLEPSIDRYTQTITRNLTTTSGTSSRTETQAIDTGFMRQLNVKVKARGFGPGETPIKMTFDGLPVDCGNDTADESGMFEGSFRIPAGIPWGTKPVIAKGPHSTASAVYVGSSVITTVTVVTRIVQSVDPLAQTFMLPESRHISGMDFWLCTNGTSQLRFQIRETELGFPTQTVLAEAVMYPHELNAGAWNHAEFPAPPYLEAGVEYALTILTDTPDFEVGIVELGDYNNETGYIRSQAYQTGVLLSSSNASTWTAHQAADMAFRLLAADFTQREHVRVLGKTDLTGITDVMPLAEVETTSPNTDIFFTLTDSSGAEVARMQAWQPTAFRAPLSGEYTLSAVMQGDEKYSPILGRDPQLVTGTIGDSGLYVSRKFRCGANRTIMVTTDEYAPSGSSVNVSVEAGSVNSYSSAAAKPMTEEPIGDGWVRRIRFIDSGLNETSIKIELTGTASARPMVKYISGVVLAKG